MDACVYVTSEYAKLYFIAFYSISVLVVMNVLTAFVLEAFLMQQQREETLKEQRRQRKRRLKERERRAEEAKQAGGASRGTMVSCMGGWRRGRGRRRRSWMRRLRLRSGCSRGVYRS